MGASRRLPKTAATALLVAAGVAAPYLVPRAERLRLVSPADLARTAGAFAGSPRAPLVRWNETPRAEAPAAAPRVPAGEPAGRGAVSAPRRAAPAVPVPAVPIEDPGGVLGPFFDRLARLGAEETDPLVRVTHFGDSPLTGDLVSGEVRELLQAELGDGGPGFVLPARPWAWYGRQGVGIDASGWKAFSPLLVPGNGGRHGFGLVSFTSGSGGAVSVVRRERGSFTRAEILLATGPGGGTLRVALDDGPPVEVPTAGEAPGTALHRETAPAGASRVVLRPKGDGDVTVLGLVLETEGPGIVWDAVGANGASVHAVNRLDQASFVAALALRRSDLVVLNYGTNESAMEGIGGPRYEREYAGTIARIRAALPGTPILVMAPMDRGTRLADGTIGTLPAIRRLVTVQRKVARENGCAFFDTFAAMGGEGTMGRWYEHEPRLVTGDFTHTTKPGSDRVARLLVGALRAARADRDAGNGDRPRAAPGDAASPTARRTPRPQAPGAEAPSQPPAVSPRPSGEPPPS